MSAYDDMLKLLLRHLQLLQLGQQLLMVIIQAPEAVNTALVLERDLNSLRLRPISTESDLRQTPQQADAGATTRRRTPSAAASASPSNCWLKALPPGAAAPHSAEIRGCFAAAIANTDAETRASRRSAAKGN
jgi:hypothetical protein